MRVVIVTDVYFPTIGGSCVATRNLSQELAKKGHDVILIAPSPTTKAYTEKEGEVTIERLASITLSRKALTRLTPDQGHVRKIIERLHPDIVHIVSPGTLGDHAITAARKLGIPVVGTTHVIAANVLAPLRLPKIINNPLEYLLNKHIKNVFQRVDYVIGPTKITTEFFKSLGLKVPMVPISNGIYLDKYSHAPKEKVAEVKEKYHFTEKPMLMYVGRLEKEKKVHVFVEAMGILKKKNIPFSAIIVGKGAEDVRLRKLAHDLSLDGTLTFITVLDLPELIALYHAIDIFVMPSDAELQCLALLEAMSAGKPAVAANALALPHLVHDKENGYLFQPNNPPDLAEKLTPLLTDAELRVKMGKESFSIASEHDMPKVIGKVEDVYEKVLANAHVKAPVVQPIPAVAPEIDA